MTWPPPPDVWLHGKTVDLAPTHPRRDAADLVTAFDHDDVWRHLPGRPSSAKAYEQALTAKVKKGWFPFTVRLRDDLNNARTGEVVGLVTYLDVSVTDARLEVATQLARPVWGTVVNPECKLLSLGYAFDVLHVARVQLKTDAMNQHSKKSMIRAGATYEGTLRSHQRRDDGTLRDNVIFSVIASEWLGVRVRLQDRIEAWTTYHG